MKKRIIILALSFIVCLPGSPPSFAAPDLAGVEGIIDRDLAGRAWSLEIVYIKDKLSHVEYRADETRPSPAPSPLPAFVISRPVVFPYGPLSVKDGGYVEKTPGSTAGLIVALGETLSGVRSILPYEKLLIKGDVTGQWKVSLADEALARIEDNIELGKLENGETVLSLGLLPPSFDPARASRLVFRMEGPRGRLLIESISFARTEAASRQTPVAAWLWNSRAVTGKETETVRQLRALGIKRLYLQAQDDPEQFLPFLRQARADGVEVYALDGYPEAAVKPEALLKRISGLIAFRKKYPDDSFPGIQLDVEPYLMKDFSVNREQHIRRYLSLMDSIAGLCKGNLRLSVVVPFWFSGVLSTGKDLVQEVLSRADEVVVMAYRRNYDEVTAVSSHALAAGERAGKPVLLGVEMTPIPDERHIVLTRAGDSASGAVELSGVRWKVGRTYTVEGNSISLDGRGDLLAAMLSRRPPFRSFGGWVIHSLDVMRQEP